MKGQRPFLGDVGLAGQSCGVRPRYWLLAMYFDLEPTNDSHTKGPRLISATSQLSAQSKEVPMKFASLHPLLLVVGLLFALPSDGFAQRELDQCQLGNYRQAFPCRIAGRVMQSDAQLRAFVAERTKKATPRGRQQVEQCGPTRQQTVFPCALEVGGFAQDSAALKDVRGRVKIARQIARTFDKNLSEKQIIEIVRTTPGIVQRLPQLGEAPQATPQLKEFPQAKPRAPARTDLPVCGSTDRQRDFPCTLVAGATAQDRRALRTVRQNVRRAQQRAKAAGRTLSAIEVAQILSATPGILVDGGQGPNIGFAEQPNAGGDRRFGDQGRVSRGVIDAASVRRADQEFATRVGQRGQDTGGRRLSPFEKTLQVGLGSLRVGTVLRSGERIISRMGDRLVIQAPNGALRVLHDGDLLVRRPGDQVQMQTYNDGSTRSVIQKRGGERVMSLRANDGRALRRARISAAGREFLLFDDTQFEQQVAVSRLPRVERQSLLAGEQSEEGLRASLQTDANKGPQSFSLRQIRAIVQVRALAPELELEMVRFQPGSAALRPEQIGALKRLGNTVRSLIANDPTSVFLIEGHTDGAGDAAYNLALSDRRAETVALALIEAFQVPSSNLISQGYGGTDLKVKSRRVESANRRIVLRNITGLLR